MLQIEYSKTAVKFINKMDRPTKQRIKAAIEGLTEQPPKGDIKTLQGYTDGRKRLRVGKYRIIYNFLPNGEIEILYIIDIDMSQRKENESMSTATKQAIDLMELLPEKDQNFALEFIKKLVIAWDPDYTKVTPAERAELERAQKEIENGETISHDAINWD